MRETLRSRFKSVKHELLSSKMTHARYGRASPEFFASLLVLLYGIANDGHRVLCNGMLLGIIPYSCHTFLLGQ